MCKAPTPQLLNFRFRKIHLYLECGIDKEKTNKELWTQFTFYKKGTRRLAVKERKQLGLAATEVNNPFLSSAYKYLAKRFFESDEPEYVVAHTFLLLEWNIISWAEYVVDSNIYLVSFQHDALMFDIDKNKRTKKVQNVLTTHGMSIPILNTLKFVHF